MQAPQIQPCLQKLSGGRFIADHPILCLLAATNRPIDPRALHAHTIATGLILDPFTASRLVQFLHSPVGGGDLRYASAVFASLRHPDAYTWNAVIACHAARRRPLLAVSYYFAMRAGPTPPSGYTFALLAKSAIAAAGTHLGLEGKVHGQLLKCGADAFVVVKNSLLRMYCNTGLLIDARVLFDETPNLDLVSWNTMISAYGKNGDLGTARELFDRAPERNLVSWSALIDGCVRNGEFTEALRLFEGLKSESIDPDAVTLASVLKACARSGDVERGRSVHQLIDRISLSGEGNLVLTTALVDMYCKCGCVDEALEVFDRVRVGGDVVLWNAMIGGLAMHGHGTRALELFGRMKEEGVSPNGATFIGALGACTHGGMVDEGIEIFESMRGCGVEPRRDHYGCVADLLGRAGLVKEAEEVLLKMPVEAEAPQWGALMSACRIHNAVDVGERVGKRLISMEPNDAGRYALLANVYSDAGKWEEMCATRREMEEKGILKETGCSFVEGGGY